MRVFLLGAILCLGCSTCCHTCCNISHQVSTRMWKVDYLGIAILIVASFYPVVYYSFYCLPELRDFYLSCVTCLGVSGFNTDDFTEVPKTFVDADSSGVVHRVGVVWFLSLVSQRFLRLESCTNANLARFLVRVTHGFLLLLGAYCYALKIPEKYWPGDSTCSGAVTISFTSWSSPARWCTTKRA